MNNNEFLSLLCRRQDAVIDALRSATQFAAASAVLDCDLAALRALDKAALERIERDAGGWSALHVAAACGWREGAEHLLDLGLDPHAEVRPFRCSAVDLACLLREPVDVAHRVADLVDAVDGTRRALTGAEWRALTGSGFINRPTAPPAYVAQLLLGDGLVVPNVLIDDEHNEPVVARALQRLRRLKPDDPGHHDALVLGWCHDDIGFGVFTDRDLVDLEFIAVYVGAVQPVPPRDVGLAHRYSFAMSLSNTRDEWVGGSRQFNVNGQHWRNIAPILNHSRLETNVGVRWLVWGGLVLALLFTNCHVPRGQQLVYNYGRSWCRLRQIDERELLRDSAPFASPGWLVPLTWPSPERPAVAPDPRL